MIVKLLISHEDASEFFENKKVGNEFLPLLKAIRFLSRKATYPLFLKDLAALTLEGV
jgi:hypothetical protein